jgi:hypothetical protein
MTCLMMSRQVEAQVTPKVHPYLSPFAIEKMRGAFAWRDLKIGRRGLRTLLDHAPKLPRFLNATRKLEELSWGGFSPWRGVSEGLDLRRGISLFWSSDQDLRLLIAYRPELAEVAFREARAFLNKGLGVSWKLTLSNSEDLPSVSGQTHTSHPPASHTQGFSKPDPHLVCKVRAKWLVCDTRGVREAKPPYWLTTDLERGALWLFVQAPKEIPQPFVLPWESFELHADLSGDELKISINLGAGFNPLLEMFKPQVELSEVTSWVHQRSPFAFKVSLDPNVIQHAGSLASQRSWIAQTQKLIKAGWGGDAMLTFDGGFDHPVVILSLSPHPWSGEKLSQTLCTMVGGRVISQAELDQERDITRDEDLSWWMIESEDQASTSASITTKGWRIPVLLGADHLVLGLFPPDVKRRGSGRFKPHEAPISLELERRGVSGGFVDPLIFEINSLNGGRVPINTLSAALIGLWREGGAGLVDVPEPLRGESNSLAGALSRLARFESEHLVSIFAPLTEDDSLFMAMSDLTSLTLQLTESIRWTLYSYTQAQTGGSGLSLELTLSIL